MAEVLFWVLLAFVPFAYLGYPALLWLTTRFDRRPEQSALPIGIDAWPRVSIVVPSADPADVLRRRLDNLRAIAYPRDRFEVIVGLDGLAADVATSGARPNGLTVRVVRSDEPIGKTALLNHLVDPSIGELVVFTDANSEFDADAVRYLVAPFLQPHVGCVTGELVYSNRGEPVVRMGEGLYWRLENAIKALESRSGKTLVATGAIYAMRRSLCRPLPPHVSDDSANPLLALAEGYDVVVEPRARAFEPAAGHSHEEFSRKARMVTRQLSAYAEVGFFLKPFRPALAFRLASHKWFRWLVPYLLLGALALNVALLHHALYRYTLGLAVTGAVVYAVGSAAVARTTRVPGVIRLWMYFCTVNAAAFVGVFDFLRGRRRIVWKISPSTR